MGCGLLAAVALATTAKLALMNDVPESGFNNDFRAGDLRNWSIAEYDFSHPHFATDWRKENLGFASEGLNLRVRSKADGPNPFSGSSIRRFEKTGFGRYSASIKPAKGPGIVTGFFVYTGPFYGSPHDEIDIEFLGSDTSKVQVGRFLNGQQEMAVVNLGFDASERFHTYGFDWTEDEIVWWVDDCPLYRMMAEQTPLPSRKSFLFANTWAVSDKLIDWAGTPSKDLDSTTVFRSISHIPFK